MSRNGQRGVEIQGVAQALIVGGIISLGIGLAIALLIGYVIRDESFNSVASLLTVSIGTNVAGVVLGIGFSLTIVGIVLGFISRPVSEAGECEEDEVESR